MELRVSRRADSWEHQIACGCSGCGPSLPGLGSLENRIGDKLGFELGRAGQVSGVCLGTADEHFVETEIADWAGTGPDEAVFPSPGVRVLAVDFSKRIPPRVSMCGGWSAVR